MNDTILRLIKLVTALTHSPGDPIYGRDMDYRIVLDYNSGKPWWTIEHDGKLWNMEKYCPPSFNGFKTFKQAELAMTEVLLKVSKEHLEWNRGLKEGEPAKKSEAKLTELEIEYLVLEIAS